MFRHSSRGDIISTAITNDLDLQLIIIFILCLLLEGERGGEGTLEVHAYARVGVSGSLGSYTLFGKKNKELRALSHPKFCEKLNI